MRIWDEVFQPKQQKKEDFLTCTCIACPSEIAQHEMVELHIHKTIIFVAKGYTGDESVPHVLVGL